MKQDIYCYTANGSKAGAKADIRDSHLVIVAWLLTIWYTTMVKDLRAPALQGSKQFQWRSF